MDWINSHIVSITIFFPLLTSLLCMTSPNLFIARWIGLIGSGACFFSALHIWYHYQASSISLQFNETYEWIGQLGINYQVGVDGLNLLFIILCTFLTPLIILNLWDKDIFKLKTLLSLIMLLETAILGVLVALDLFFFYFCWEVMIIPVYFIIGIWGGKKRIHASTKLFIYNVCASLFMLIAIIVLYTRHAMEFGFYSASLFDLLKISPPGFSTQSWLFAAFALAFAVKTPVWPFHTWFVLANSHISILGSIILSGVLLKIGCYGFLRFAIPLFPDAATLSAPLISSLGLIGLVFLALNAWSQEDAKKIAVYASISHFSLIVAGCGAFSQRGLSPEALLGAVYRTINHGISFTALFFLLALIYDRCATLKLSALEASPKKIRYLTIILIFITLDCIGLPGTGGFIGQFLILKGLFTSNPIIGGFAILGIIIGACYMIKLSKAILSGSSTIQEDANLSDFTIKEKLVIIPLITVALAMGAYPELFLAKVRPTIEHLAKYYKHYHLVSKTGLSYKPKPTQTNRYTDEIRGGK